jgi:hypothetical protein
MHLIALPLAQPISKILSLLLIFKSANKACSIFRIICSLVSLKYLLF